MQLDIQSEEVEKLRESLRYQEISNQELQNTIVQLRSEAERQARRHHEEVEGLRGQEEAAKAAHQKEVSDLNKQFEDVITRGRAKLEEKRQELKEVKAKFKTAVA